MKPQISVIMLTCNREEYVGRAIESILNQTFEDYEFILVDNGSTDRSGKICDDFQKLDNRIRVRHLPKGSIGSGRNAGLDMAEGEYITFIDDDDWCEPDYLGFLYELMFENNADVSICGSRDKAYEEKRIMNPEEALIELLKRKRFNMAFPTKMFTRKLGCQIRFPEQDRYDDISQMYRLLAKAKKIAYHGLPKYTFYRHNGNHSAWTTDYTLLTPQILDEYLKAYDERTSWLAELYPVSIEHWNYFKWSFMISMVDKINKYHITSCEIQMKKMKQELNNSASYFLNSILISDYEKEWMKKYIL